MPAIGSSQVGTPTPPSRDEAQLAFRQFLREADKHIKEGRFEDAQREIAEARKLDPSNPFIKAFEERINIFKEKKSTSAKATLAATEEPPAAELPEPSVEPPVQEQHEDQPALEQRLRHELEGEYKARFTAELKRAEEQALNLVKEERATIDEQRNALQAKFDKELEEARQRLEKEYQHKLAEELARAEERLREESVAQAARAEKELQARLEKVHHAEIEKLQEQLKKEQAALLEREKAALSDRDRATREQFDKQLVEALRKTEHLMRDQLAAQQKKENEELRQKLQADFQEKLQQERDAIVRHYEEEKKKLEASLGHEREKLSEAHQRELLEHESKVRSSDAQAFERRQAEIKQELEAELRKLQEQSKAQQEAMLAKERAAVADRERLTREEYDRHLVDALRKAEDAIRQKLTEQHQKNEEKLRKDLTKEFEERLQKERDGVAASFAKDRKSLEQTSSEELRKLQKAHKHELEKLEATIREGEHDSYEHKKAELRTEIERQLQATYKAQLEAERQRIENDSAAALDAEKRRLEEEYAQRISSQESNLKSVRAKLQKEMEASFLKRMEQIAQEYDYKMELLGTRVPETPEEKQALYRERMRAAYANGVPSVEEARIIMGLKELLELSFDDHLAIEADIRLDLYTENVERRIISGELNVKDTSVLDQLKQAFRITPEESVKLEPYILSSIQRLAVKGRILIADDDLLLLQSIDSLLSDCGYHVVPAASVQEANELLAKTSVDLILSDIKFGESELDGFQFFLEVQAQPHLRRIPFVFMSSLRDGVIIRSGVQLGVDDYLTKPIDPDLLLAVIEGKLKRYRAIAQN